ncbi:hypothetical protein GCM10018952_03790 [Streptosporangium vulgare]
MTSTRHDSGPCHSWRADTLREPTLPKRVRFRSLRASGAGVLPERGRSEAGALPSRGAPREHGSGSVRAR